MNDRKPDGSLNNKRIHITPETKDAIETLVRERGYEVASLPKWKPNRDILKLGEDGKMFYSSLNDMKLTPIHYDPETNSLVEDKTNLENLLEESLKSKGFKNAFNEKLSNLADEEPSEELKQAMLESIDSINVEEISFEEFKKSFLDDTPKEANEDTCKWDKQFIGYETSCGNKNGIAEKDYKEFSVCAYCNKPLEKD